jgi:lambda repressor-like predicted transcriptional regulator
MSPFKLHLFGRPTDLAAADSASTDAGPAQVVSADTSLASQAGDANSSKIARILAAISSPDGATVEELAALSGWQPHTIRAALSRQRRKGVRIVHGADATGRRVYRLASDGVEA